MLQSSATLSSIASAETAEQAKDWMRKRLEYLVAQASQSPNAYLRMKMRHVRAGITLHLYADRYKHDALYEYFRIFTASNFAIQFHEVVKAFRKEHPEWDVVIGGGDLHIEKRNPAAQA